MKVAEALRAAAERIDRLDAEVLLAHQLGVDRGTLLLNQDVSIDQQAYEILLNRRATHEPVAYITGHREFWSLDLIVTPAVLIPRPDSETLIEAALASRIAPRTILDLGTGSGALLLAALTEFPDAAGVGIDASPAALDVARRNAEKLGLAGRARFQIGDWGQGVDQRFDLILCNPPYVETSAKLAADVRDHEPAAALFSGPDGLDDYRRLLPQLGNLLTADGIGIVEIGNTQALAVSTLAAGFDASIHKDLAGHDRCLVFRRKVSA